MELRSKIQYLCVTPIGERIEYMLNKQQCHSLIKDKNALLLMRNSIL